MKFRVFTCLFCLLLFMECMKPEPTDTTEEGSTSTLPEDNGLRAGATSTTNWPAEFGSEPKQISIEADSVFSLFFKMHGVTALDPQFIPIKLAGKASVFRGGVITPLDSCPQASMDFDSTDHLKLPASLLAPLLRTGDDTLFFNLRVDVDTLQAWSFGYGYLPATGKFFKTAFSIETEGRITFWQAWSSFIGRIDTTNWKSKPELSGKSVLSFYIPGAPVFRIMDGDSVDLGPVPKGTYPLRLLRVTYAEGNGGGTEIEVFEVKTRRPAADVHEYIFEPGASVLKYRTERTISLRSDAMR